MRSRRLTTDASTSWRRFLTRATATSSPRCSRPWRGSTSTPGYVEDHIARRMCSRGLCEVDLARRRHRVDVTTVRPRAQSVHHSWRVIYSKLGRHVCCGATGVPALVSTTPAKAVDASIPIDTRPPCSPHPLVLRVRSASAAVWLSMRRALDRSRPESYTRSAVVAGSTALFGGSSDA